MIKFLKNLFGMDKSSESNTATEVPYKIETPTAPVTEPVKVEATPVQTKPQAKTPAKPKAPAKAKAPAKPRAPRKPKMTVAK